MYAKKKELHNGRHLERITKQHYAIIMLIK